MVFVFSVVLPIFGLILAGWIARRIGVLGPAATSELNRFVVYLALPAMLFHLVTTAHWVEIWQPGFLAAFGIGAATVYGATLMWSMVVAKRYLADAAIDGLNAGYPNTGFIGFPLVLAALGTSALVTALLATIVTGCAMFALAIVLIEIGLQAETSRRRMVGKVALTLARNPLLLAPIMGALYAGTGVGLAAPVESFLKLLGGAAAPCALVALGLFLAEKRTSRARSSAVAALVGLKLFIQPGLTWVLAVVVFRLPPLLVHCAVLLAALPTGTGAFMLAEFYRRDADLTARVMLISTIASVATISAYLALVG